MMFPSNSTQVSTFANTAVIHDIPALNQFNPNQSPATVMGQMSDSLPQYVDSMFSNSKKLQDELEKTGSKLKHHEENLKFLYTYRNQLEESILDMQVSLSKCVSSAATKKEHEDPSHARDEEETVKQILRHEKSAAGVLCQLKICHVSQTSNPPLTQDIVGVVAMLGKVEDDKLSRILSEFLGLDTMLAIVCKTYDGMKALELYDNDGTINKGSGIYGLGSSIGRTLEGRFLSICLESLRPYAGEFLVGDTQKRLNIPKPRLPSGDSPPGFLGYAVDMIKIDISNLYCLTSRGYGLRETLFYNLFSRLQVYRTRAEMLLALPCISDGAVSLDGGLMKKTGLFYLGSRQREELGVRFPKCSQSLDLSGKYLEMERQLKHKQWEMERILEDMQREQTLLEQAKDKFQIKKKEFVKFLADSSSFSYMQQHRMQAVTQGSQSPR